MFKKFIVLSLVVISMLLAVASASATDENPVNPGPSVNSIVIDPLGVNGSILIKVHLTVYDNCYDLQKTTINGTNRTLVTFWQDPDIPNPDPELACTHEPYDTIQYFRVQVTNYKLHLLRVQTTLVDFKP